MAATPATARSEPAADVTVHRLTGSVAVEVRGVDLNQPIDDRLAATLRDALFGNCALVVRRQFLTPEAHLALARVFGEPFLPHYYARNAIEGHPDIAEVPNFGKVRAPAEAWHTDWSHMSKPPTVSVALAHVLPAAGGDTMFSNQYRAYDQLSDGMKEFLDDRRVKFVGSRPVSDGERMQGTADLLPDAKKVAVEHYHPITPVHPGTGRRALYLNRPGEAMVQFEGMTPDESLPILQYLYDQSTPPDNVYRHMWQPGDVVCWDNRCAMHYGVHDYGDEERTLHRITVDGAV